MGGWVMGGWARLDAAVGRVGLVSALGRVGLVSILTGCDGGMVVPTAAIDPILVAADDPTCAIENGAEALPAW